MLQIVDCTDMIVIISFDFSNAHCLFNSNVLQKCGIIIEASAPAYSEHNLADLEDLSYIERDELDYPVFNTSQSLNLCEGILKERTEVT